MTHVMRNLLQRKIFFQTKPHLLARQIPKPRKDLRSIKINQKFILIEYSKIM